MRTPTNVRTRTLIVFLFAHATAMAQPVNFGSADDPSETATGPVWRRSINADIRGGLSLIGPDWRAATGVTVEYRGIDLSARFNGTFRGGISGAYDPDINGAYDLLRLVEYVRLTPSPRGFYLRAGPTNRFRLGNGHVANFFSSETVWDDRTVGLEAVWPGPMFDVSVFSDDVRMNRVMGGRVAIRPLFWAREEKARSLEIGAAYVTDRRQFGGEPLITAYTFDLRFTAASVGEVIIQPFATVSAYRDAGAGFGLGGEMMSDNFIDVARFRLRFALYVSDDGFIPGYVGALYRVSNPDARIVKSEDFSGTDPIDAVVGIALQDAERGTSFETELRVLFFDQFEFWYSFRRHFGGAPLSEYHLRLFFQTGRLSAQVSQDRGGLKSFFTLFNDVGDQTTLQFRTDYHVARGFWLFVRAIYSYERAEQQADGPERFVVQRRFEPYTGLRFRF